jgi:hypothetical protein
MTWHETVEGALGLAHPTRVEEHLLNRIHGWRWHIYCDGCGGYLNYFEDPVTAQRFADRHAEAMEFSPRVYEVPTAYDKTRPTKSG